MVRNLTIHVYTTLEDCTQNIIEGGAIESIVQLLHSENPIYQHFSALALANLVVDVTTISRVLATPCIDRIVDLCYSSQPPIRRQTTRILNSIASYPTGVYQEVLITSDSRLALEHVMEAHDHNASPEHPSTHDLALTALAYIDGTFFFLYSPERLCLILFRHNCANYSSSST